MSELKPSTRRLLQSLHSRREHLLSDRRHPVTGYWIITRRRVRTLVDYDLLAHHNRAPKRVRDHARRWIGRAVNEARRWEMQFGERP